MVREKILFFALESINNAGDEILRVTTEYLVRSVSSDFIINRVQLMPKLKNLSGLDALFFISGGCLNRCASLFKGDLKYIIINLSYKIKYYHLFRKSIKETDRVILPIGMLKYSTQNFSYVFALIIHLSTRYRKPVMMSAMSPEVGNPLDWRYRQLVQAVNQPSVKYITTRDGQQGIDIIKKDYLKRNILCDYVGDPALWIPVCYNIQPTHHDVDNPYVGINVVRKGIFRDYNQSWNDEDLFSFYVNLISLFEEKGWRWAIFCNGMEQDWEMIKDIQSVLHFSERHILLKPSNGKMFVEMISKFDVIFGARLHTCITSVSLGVPVVGFVWDDKLRHFSTTMHIEHFFFEPSSLEAKKVFETMKMAMRFDLDNDNKEKYMNKTKESLRFFLETNYI